MCSFALHLLAVSVLFLASCATLATALRPHRNGKNSLPVG